jgi:hypothetical protein
VLAGPSAPISCKAKNGRPSRERLLLVAMVFSKLPEARYITINIQ